MPRELQNAWDSIDGKKGEPHRHPIVQPTDPRGTVIALRKCEIA